VIGRASISVSAFGSAGTTDNSPAFQCRDRPEKTSSPGGTKGISAAPAGLCFFLIRPAVETAGYFRLSRRDLNWFASLTF
jgi:hypothetical protein